MLKGKGIVRKSKPLSRLSGKTRDRLAEARPVREALVAKAGKCYICGAFPGCRNGRMSELNQLAVHEIANGPLRMKAIDKPFATLVVCWHCNGELNDKSVWPVARQLAVLQAKSPDDYDLVAFNYLANPKALNRWTQEEVDHWLLQLQGQ